MRVPTGDRPAGVDLNVTPLIDVVFLLIVFFLVSSHLASREVQVELELPEATSGRRAPPPQAARVTINVLPDGRLLLAGAVVGPEQLRRRLAFESARAGVDLVVRVRGDRDVPYQFVEPVLIGCARAGIWNVSFAVTRRDSDPGHDRR